MSRMTEIALALSVAALSAGLAPSALAQEKNALRVVSQRTLAGFVFPESVGCDAQGKALYVSQFGSELKPTQKDGMGRISKLTLDGKMIEERFLPAAGGKLDKPKGIWIDGGRLWVTDIDVVWEFDLATRKGRKVALPGAKFANDPAVQGGALYVSDNRGDQLFRVEPAAFLGMKGEPGVSVVFSGAAANPNGVYPARDGSVLAVGFKSGDEPRAIYSVAGGEPKALSDPIGRLDGVAELADGSLLVTDWNSGTLFRWSAGTGMETLASGFKGPADLCVAPDGAGYLVAVPDLVASEVRLIRLAPR